MEMSSNTLDRIEVTQEKKVEGVSQFEVQKDTIIITSESGEVVNLKEYLPKNVIFELGEEFTATFHNNNSCTVTYNPLVGVSRALLSILHEVGHFKYKNYHRFVLRPSKLLKAIAKNYKAFVLADKSTEEKGAIELALMEGRFHKAKGDVQVKVERESWYYALTVSRKIKELHNIDILSDFGGFNSAKDFIDVCLSTYKVAGVVDALNAFNSRLKK